MAVHRMEIDGVPVESLTPLTAIMIDAVRRLIAELRPLKAIDISIIRVRG